MAQITNVNSLFSGIRRDLENEILLCDKKIDYHSMMAETDIANLYREKRRMAVDRLKSMLEYQTRPPKQQVQKVKMKWYQQIICLFFPSIYS